MTLTGPVGCDTFVALPSSTSTRGAVIFGKNSDRPSGEKQSVRRYPAREWNAGDMVSCTYVAIPQARRTHAVLLSQIDWMWGAEMGANDRGVVIGNEAVWTKEPDLTDDGGKALLGMDLVRLGLERGDSARGALNVITSLLEEHGQGGPCAENDPSFSYHNSYLIADSREAYVLETAGVEWAAQRITQGVKNISNCLTIRKAFDLSSTGLKDRAREKGYWDGKEPFDFAKCYSEGPVEESPDSRLLKGAALLERHSGNLNAEVMMDVLRDHEGGICMHGGGFETTASMVSELRPDGKASHWLTGKPHPCKSSFLPQQVC